MSEKYGLVSSKITLGFWEWETSGCWGQGSWGLGLQGIFINEDPQESHPSMRETAKEQERSAERDNRVKEQ